MEVSSPVLTGSSVVAVGSVPSSPSSVSVSTAVSNHLSSNNIKSNNVLVQQLNNGPVGESGSQSSSSSSSSQKRPMNAFLIFCKRHRSVVKSKYPHLENRSITKILGEWWAALDADQKQKYTELARQYKEAFMKANPHFKWYKTDNFTPRAPPPMQPSSPPHHGLQSLHLNSNNSGSEATIASSVGASSASSSAAPPVIAAAIQPSSNNTASEGGSNPVVMGIMKETQVHNVVNNNHISNHSSPANNNSVNPPKPPKKRYLENSEFRSTLAGPMPGVQQPPVNSVVLTATNNPSVTSLSSSNPVINSLVPKGEKKASLPLGPPGMLDVDTMSRVIVDALAAGPNPAPSTYMNYVDRTSPPTALNYVDRTSPPTALNYVDRTSPSAKHSPVNDGGDSVGSGGSNGPHFGTRGRSSSPESPSYQKTARNDRSGTSSPVESNGAKTVQSVASLTAESLLNAESQQPLGSATKAVAAIVSAKHSSTGGSGLLPSSATVPNSPPSPTQSMEEEKPLNLSSSKVLHASHQQIIDHFIDKLLSSGGECAHGNPMPVEMMQTSSSCLPASAQMAGSVPAISGTSGGSCGSSSKNGPKKERTCKGKRYLDMMNESKGSGNGVIQPGGKKWKSGMTEGAESPSKESKGSKWVSGGFDLEEHIAALPQLGDAHLLTALNNSKNKVNPPAVNGKGSPIHSHHRMSTHSQGRHSDRDSDGSRSPSSPSRVPSSPSRVPSSPSRVPSSPSGVHHGDRSSTSPSGVHHGDRSSSSPSGVHHGDRSSSSPSGVHHGDNTKSAAVLNHYNSKHSDSESKHSDSESKHSDSESSSEPCLKLVTEDPMSMKSRTMSSSGSNSPVNGQESSGESNEKRSIVARELLASAGFSLSRSSQGIEVGPCDGLAALAEVALSQAQAISTTTSS